MILRDKDGNETEHHWFLPVDLSKADPMALKIGGYYERHPQVGAQTTTPANFAREFTRLTLGAHLVGAVISFDEQRLYRLLRRNGQCPMWHYHIIDVEALAIGYAAANAKHGSDESTDGLTGESGESISVIEPPWDSDDLTEAIGVEVPEDERHTALGDARWAQSIYDRIMGLENE